MSAIANGAKISRVHSKNLNCTISSLSDESGKKLKGLLDNLNNPHIFGLDARELFFLHDKVILVEGQEDVIFYQLIAKDLQIPLKGDFFGWGVGGAGNMDTIAKIVFDLGFEKVVGILDKDKKHLIEPLSKDYPDYHFVCIPANDVRTKKATVAKEEILGLLDNKREIREEFKKDLTIIFQDVNTLFN